MLTGSSKYYSQYNGCNVADPHSGVAEGFVLLVCDALSLGVVPCFVGLWACIFVGQTAQEK
jgi:hypothetical protein